MSAECRRELRFFAGRATALGLRDLVLPLLYVEVPALHQESAADNPIQLVRTFQWEDWRELRLLNPTGEEYDAGSPNWPADSLRQIGAPSALSLLSLRNPLVWPMPSAQKVQAFLIAWQRQKMPFLIGATSSLTLVETSK